MKNQAARGTGHHYPAAVNAKTYWAPNSLIVASIFFFLVFLKPNLTSFSKSLFPPKNPSYYWSFCRNIPLHTFPYYKTGCISGFTINILLLTSIQYKVPGSILSQSHHYRKYFFSRNTPLLSLPLPLIIATHSSSNSSKRPRWLPMAWTWAAGPGSPGRKENTPLFLWGLSSGLWEMKLPGGEDFAFYATFCKYCLCKYYLLPYFFLQGNR